MYDEKGMTAANSKADITLVARVSDVLEGLYDEHRQRVARTLHDQVAQSLSAAVMNLTLVERSAPGLPDDARQALERAVALLTESCREVSELSHDLLPVFLGRRGLGDGLGHLLHRRFSDRRIDFSMGEGITADPGSLRACCAFVELAVTACDATEPVDLKVYAAGPQFFVSLSGRWEAERDVAAVLAAIERRIERAAGTLRAGPLEPGGPVSLTASFPIDRSREDRGP